MRTRFVFTLMLGLALMLTAMSFAEEQAEQPAAKETKPVLHNQTNCPVMGGKIDSTVYTDIQGQRVYHCCPMCSAKLKADPDKYFKQAAAEGVLFENIQTTCPVSGKELEAREAFVDYDGRRIYFCCEMCPPRFAADPAKYIGRLEPVAKPDSEKADENAGDGMKMDSHDH